MATIGRRPGWGFLIVIVGMAIPVSNVIAAAAVFWSLIGVFLGFAMERFSKELHTA